MHIFTMLVAVYLRIKQYGMDQWALDVLKRDIFLNIFLIQSWYPAVNVNVSLNGVAWYLSSITFCYLMFVPIHRCLMNKSYSTLRIVITFILASQIVVSLIAICVNPEDNIYRWVTYDAPFFRIGDFAIGCIWYHLSNSELGSKSLSKGMYNFIEIVLFLITMIVVFWDHHFIHNTMFSKIFNNWTTIYIPFACLWISLFMVNQGIITQVFTNPINIWMGRNSLYLFMFHSIVIYCLKVIIPEFAVRISFYGIIIVMLLTLSITNVYKRLEHILSRRIIAAYTRILQGLGGKRKCD